MENEIEKKIKDIFDLFKGGYSQVQQLIQYIDVVQFMLKHGDSNKIMDRLHVFIGVAEFTLLLLEEECDTLEKVIEPPSSAPLIGPNNGISRLAKWYMKLERIYLT